MPSWDDIVDATDKYVTELQTYDISGILDEILSYEAPDLTSVDVLRYPGMLNIDLKTSKKSILNYPVKLGRKKYTLENVFTPTDNHYNIGIFSVSLDETMAHYLAFILDNIKKEVFLWDSAVNNSILEETEARKIILTIFPNYKLKGIEICDGCSSQCSEEGLCWQPGAGVGEERSFETQNIFCHTWSLWFLYTIIFGLNKGYTVDHMINILNTTCDSPRQNLITIKQFAKYISQEYFSEEFELPKAFDYIWDKKKTVKVLS